MNSTKTEQKKHSSPILINTYSAILFIILITILHTTITYTATVAKNSPHLTSFAPNTPQQIAIAAALKNHLSQDVLNLVIQYYAPQWKKPRWKAQTILPGRLVFDVIPVPQKECIAVSLEHDRITLLSPETGVPIHDINVGSTFGGLRSNTFDFSPNGNILAASADHMIYIIDSLTGDPVLRLNNQNTIQRIKFLNLNQFVTSSYVDETIQLWDIETKKCIQKIPLDLGFFTASLDGQFLAVYDKYPYKKLRLLPAIIKIWRANDNNTFYCARTIKNMDSTPSRMAFSPDNRQLAIGSQESFQPSYCKIYIKNPKTGKSIHTLNLNTKIICSLAYSPKNLLAAGTEDGTISLWDPRKGLLLNRLESHQNAVTTLFFSPDGTHLVSGSRNNFSASCYEGVKKGIIKISKIKPIEEKKEKNSCCIS